MDKRKYQSYMEEFRREAEKRVSQPGNIATSLAKELGVHPVQVSNWKRELKHLSEKQFNSMNCVDCLNTENESVRKLKSERDALKKETNPRNNRYTRLFFYTKIMPIQELSRTISFHLDNTEIWHHWARTCTRLLPLFGELRETRPLFESSWSFASYLAHQFVLMTGRVTICKYSYTNQSGGMLMKRIQKIVEDNRHKGASRA